MRSRCPPSSSTGGCARTGSLLLIGHFLVDLVGASWQVMRLAFGRRRPRNAVIEVQLRSRSDFYLTITAELVALVPGSVVIDARRSTSVLYLHLLDVEREGAIEAQRAHVLAVERRVVRALGSREEIAALETDGPWPTAPTPAPTRRSARDHRPRHLRSPCSARRRRSCSSASSAGPSNLDRIVAAEILLVIVIAGVALESARQRTTTYLPLLMILGLVGFVGGVAVTRFLSRDSDEPDGERPSAEQLARGAAMTWTSLLDVAGAVCLLLGSFLCLAGAVGLIRFPDTLSRLHAATKPQTLGLILILAGLALTLRTWAAVTTLVLLAATQFFTSPVSAHLVGRAAYRNRRVDTGTLEVDELSDALERSGLGPDGLRPAGRHTPIGV